MSRRRGSDGVVTLRWILSAILFLVWFYFLFIPVRGLPGWATSALTIAALRGFVWVIFVNLGHAREAAAWQ